MQPTNPLINALLTDKYQLSMAYAYWKNGIHETDAVFNLFFRKCPFKGEFAFFVGLDEALRFVENFGFSASDIEYLKRKMPECEPEFFDWLAVQNTSKIRIKAFPEGNLAFPHEPLMEVSGPLAVGQLLETTLINQTGFPTLCATNAARFRIAVGRHKKLVEFSLRRTQGADGGVTAARSSYAGGFDGTSNVLAGKLYDIPIFGTMAHSYITAFSGITPKVKMNVRNKHTGRMQNIRRTVFKYRELLGFQNTSTSELEAFTAFAFAYPNGFLALVDTYNTLRSGVPNYIAVALALIEYGYQPLGIRLDSGDLALLSKQAREKIEYAAWAFQQFSESLLRSQILASNDINHDTVRNIKEAGHAIDVFCIGTHQGTCKDQPAIGMVYKLVQIAGKPCLKVSEDADKTTWPGEKKVYRLWGKGAPVADIIILDYEAPPEPEKEIEVHTNDGVLTVWPTRVDWLNPQQWPNIHLLSDKPNLTIHEIRERVLDWLETFPEKHLRLESPEKYHVGVSLKLKRLQAKLLATNC